MRRPQPIRAFEGQLQRYSMMLEAHTEHDESAHVLVLAPVSREVCVLEDVLQDADEVSDMIGVPVVEEECYSSTTSALEW